MKFGCCASMIDPGRDPIGIEFVELMRRIGFDYAELSLRDIMQLTDREFRTLEKRLAASGLRCEACNNFMAFGLRATGAGADHRAIIEYCRAAFGRASALGAEVIVFGSPWSRDPEIGFEHAAAWSQLSALLREMGPVAEKYGVTVAMENANRVDTNILNTVEECCRLVREVAHPNIRVLMDYYHLALEKESPDVILAADEDLRHIHLARLYRRGYPADSRDGTDYAALFANLARIGYDNRISLEANSADFVRAAAASLAFLRGLIV